MRSLRFSLFFLLLNSPQNIAGPGNIGQVNLGLLLGRSGLGRRTRRRFAPAAQGGAHTPGLVFLNRTGVRLLLRNSNGFENIKNGPALDFQFTC